MIEHGSEGAVLHTWSEKYQMTDSRRRLTGLLISGSIFGLLMFVGAMAFLAGLWVMAQNCSTSGMSPRTRDLHGFVWFALDYQMLAGHMAVTATLVAASTCLRRGEISLGITQGFAAASSLQLVVFVCLWPLLLHHVSFAMRSTLAVAFFAPVGCAVVALVLCLLHVPYRFRSGQGLLLALPLLVLSGVGWVALTAKWYGDMELPGSLQHIRLPLLGLPVLVVPGVLVMRRVAARYGRSGAAESACWMVSIASTTFVQVCLAMMISPFRYGISMVGPHPWSQYNLLIHAVFLPIELWLIAAIWQRRDAFAMLGKPKHGFPIVCKKGLGRPG